MARIIWSTLWALEKTTRTDCGSGPPDEPIPVDPVPPIPTPKALLQVVIKPFGHAPRDVAPAFGVGNVMALARINHQLVIDSQNSERVPEFHGLRRRAFAIAFADHNQRG